MDLKSKRAAVLGAGRSGIAAARLLRHFGADVCVFDSGEGFPDWDNSIRLVSGATEQDGRDYAAELVVISPGVETDSSFVKAYAESAGELIGETELASRFYHGTIIAITGTNGKTTTTGLIEKILLKAGCNAVACGNYGLPMSEVILMERVPDILALEVSSFQMETIRFFHPPIAIWLNFAPDHMDRYRTVEEYYEAKFHIFDNQGPSDLAIIRQGENLPGLQARTLTFSAMDQEGNACYRDGKIIVDGQAVLDIGKTTMAHPHNAENVMAAFLACRSLDIPAGVVQEVIDTFIPPGHRCELVRELDGVKWYNDSKATNLHALEAAVKSLPAPIVLIAGGKDKGLDYHELTPLLQEKVRGCIVFGEIAGQLHDTFAPVVPTSVCEDVANCVNQARQMARAGDSVLFSPGTSSFDMFTGYVQRGQVFRDAVNQLTPPTK